MTTETRSIAAATHGRYLLTLPESPAPRPGGYPLLVGFHGYGENAEIHLGALRAIPGSERWAVCSVQALHRFYDRRNQEVVACWMTRQDRELAIADNIAYVGAVVGELRRQAWAGETLVYVGFSQGVAMAYRAAAFAGVRASGVIALAGDVPPDVIATGMKDFPELLMGTGSADTWYTPARLAEDRAKLEAMALRPTTLVFEGGHEWADAFRRQAAEFLSARLER